jgi:hypothetical protein
MTSVNTLPAEQVTTLNADELLKAASAGRVAELLFNEAAQKISTDDPADDLLNTGIADGLSWWTGLRSTAGRRAREG